MYPYYIHDGKKKILPIPVVLILPGNIGHQMMQNNIWLKYLSQYISQLCLNHLHINDDEQSKNIRVLLDFATKKILTSLRIFNINLHKW